MRILLLQGINQPNSILTSTSLRHKNKNKVSSVNTTIEWQKEEGRENKRMVRQCLLLLLLHTLAVPRPPHSLVLYCSIIAYKHGKRYLPHLESPSDKLSYLPPLLYFRKDRAARTRRRRRKRKRRFLSSSSSSSEECYFRCFRRDKEWWLQSSRLHFPAVDRL